jgi:hypothetical protein
MEEAIVKMTESVNRLAIIEDQQLAYLPAVDRAFKEVEDIKKMQTEHEKQIILNARTSVWVDATGLVV